MDINIEKEYDKIYRYCYFKLHHAQTAEDITQETFLKYFSQMSYVNQGKPLAYLYTIARNLCMDHFRKVQTLPLEENLDAQPTLMHFEENMDLKMALEHLPKDLQELILLRYVNELSMKELTALTGESRFCIYRKLHTALLHLKEHLREE